MKKIGAVLKKLLVMFFVFLLVFSSTIPAAAAESSTYRTAKIQKLNGAVTVMRSGGDKPFSAFKGMSLTQGDTLMTGKDSSATLYIDDDKEVKVDENTKINMSELGGSLVKKSESTGIKLWFGKVFASIKKKLSIRSKFEIKTPTTVAGARGTVFYVGQDGPRTDIAVLDGSVAVETTESDASKPVELVVPANQQINLDGSVQPSGRLQPQPVTPQSLDLFVLQTIQELAQSAPNGIPEGISPALVNGIEPVIEQKKKDKVQEEGKKAEEAQQASEIHGVIHDPQVEPISTPAPTPTPVPASVPSSPPVGTYTPPSSSTPQQPLAVVLDPAANHISPVPGTTAGTIILPGLVLPGGITGGKWQVKVGSNFSPPNLNDTVSGVIDNYSGTDIPVSAGQHILLLATDGNGRVKAYYDLGNLPMIAGTSGPSVTSVGITGDVGGEFLQNKELSATSTVGQTQGLAVTVAYRWFTASDAAGSNKALIASGPSFTPRAAITGQYLIVDAEPSFDLGGVTYTGITVPSAVYGPILSKVAINKLDDLARIGADSAFPLNGSYLLTSDLDFNDNSSYQDTTKKSGWTSGLGWLPVGDDNNKFSGTFDGNGKTIHNLYVNRTSNANYAGLFGYSTGTIQNLGVTYLHIEGSLVTGGLVGYNTGTIMDSFTFPAGSGSCVSGPGPAGGLAGVNSGSILNSYSSAEVHGKGQVGGLIGFNDGTASTCYASGAVYGIANVSGELYIGGLVGSSSAGTGTGTVQCSFALNPTLGCSSITGLRFYYAGKVAGRIINSYMNYGLDSMILDRNTISGVQGITVNNVYCDGTNILLADAILETSYTNPPTSWGFDGNSDALPWKMPGSGYPVFYWQ